MFTHCFRYPNVNFTRHKQWSVNGRFYHNNNYKFIITIISIGLWIQKRKICDTKGNVNRRRIISQPSIIIHTWANKEKIGFSKTFEPKNCKWTTKQIDTKSISQTSRGMKWNRRRNFQWKLSKKLFELTTCALMMSPGRKEEYISTLSISVARTSCCLIKKQI